MRLYLNTSAYNRPFDDLTVDRVRVEAEAVASLLAAVEEGARALERHGLRGLDALHVAAAETGKADLLVTTDDRLVKRAARAGVRIATRIVYPPEALVELFRTEDR